MVRIVTRIVKMVTRTVIIATKIIMLVASLVRKRNRTQYYDMDGHGGTQYHGSHTLPLWGSVPSLART